MKVKWKIRMINVLSYACLYGILVGFAIASQCIDFKKAPVGSIITLALAAIGASKIAYNIEKWLWNKYIKKLREMYDRQKRASSINEDN